jgi:hypothetical protein
VVLAGVRADAAAAQGRWRDVEPAVLFACSECLVAVVRGLDPEPGVRVYEIVTVQDENVLLRVGAPGGAPARDDDTVDLRIECSFGRFGDAEREASFNRAIARRLEALAGR